MSRSGTCRRLTLDGFSTRPAASMMADRSAAPAITMDKREDFSSLRSDSQLSKKEVGWGVLSCGNAIYQPKFRATQCLRLYPKFG